MRIKFQIKKVTVRPNDFIVETKAVKDNKNAFYKKYFLTFNKGLRYNPNQVVRKIATFMAERTGGNRKARGTVIRNKMFKMTEDEFEKRVYYFWNSCNYDYRIGERGLFKIRFERKGELIEEKDIKYRMAFCQALLQRQGGKKSGESYFWLGDYLRTKIIFEPDYTFEPSFKDEHLSTSHYLQMGISLAKVGSQSRNEEYVERSIEYFNLALKLNKQSAEAYVNLSGAFLAIAQIRSDKEYYLKSLRHTALAQKYNNELPQIYLNRGITLYHLSETLNRPNLCLKAIDNFMLSIEKDDGNAFTYFCCANSFHRLAEIKNDIELYEKSICYYKHSVDRKKDYKTYMNLGNALAALAEYSGNGEIFLEAADAYQLASTLDEESIFIYLNWGTCLARCAHLSGDDKTAKEGVSILFKSFAKAILQKQWDIAAHIASSTILKIIKNDIENSLYLIVISFLEGIQVISTRKKLSMNRIEEITKWQGHIDEVDIVINAILGKIDKDNKKKGKDDAILKCSILLRDEIVKVLY